MEINALAPLAKDADVESVFSEQDTVNDETVFAVQITSDEDSDYSSTNEENDESDQDSDSSIEDLPIFSSVSCNVNSPDTPMPFVKMKILPFARPVKLIGYMDTGAQTFMMNPSVLPDEAWGHCIRHFKRLITKPENPD